MFENTFFISLIGFLIVLTPLVFIHELGHYLAAIKNGVIVEQFSVGFGPELIGFNLLIMKIIKIMITKDILIMQVYLLVYQLFFQVH